MKIDFVFVSLNLNNITQQKAPEKCGFYGSVALLFFRKQRT